MWCWHGYPSIFLFIYLSLLPFIHPIYPTSVYISVWPPWPSVHPWIHLSSVISLIFPSLHPSNLSISTQNLLRITFSFNDLMLKTNRLKKDFFYKDSLLFRLDDPVANMSIRHVYYARGAREKTYPLKRVSFCLVSSSALVHLANFQLSYQKF